eukprot:TRINITY_DN1576_c0_g1_i1.p1 TRINITY_DN1576_c0_g1~~TRINITY_DN1576_c0_g1_i1.p1  ORF type:complete len:779 (+),score=300.06 TRINITY_DN1576_c0_g1_i1:15-2351(+)
MDNQEIDCSNKIKSTTSDLNLISTTSDSNSITSSTTSDSSSTTNGFGTRSSAESPLLKTGSKLQLWGNDTATISKLTPLRKLGNIDKSSRDSKTLLGSAALIKLKVILPQESNSSDIEPRESIVPSYSSVLQVKNLIFRNILELRSLNPENFLLGISENQKFANEEISFGKSNELVKALIQADKPVLISVYLKPTKSSSGNIYSSVESFYNSSATVHSFTVTSNSAPTKTNSKPSISELKAILTEPVIDKSILQMVNSKSKPMVTPLRLRTSTASSHSPLSHFATPRSSKKDKGFRMTDAILDLQIEQITKSKNRKSVEILSNINTNTSINTNINTNSNTNSNSNTDTNTNSNTVIKIPKFNVEDENELSNHESSGALSPRQHLLQRYESALHTPLSETAQVATAQKNSDNQIEPIVVDSSIFMCDNGTAMPMHVYDPRNLQLECAWSDIAYYQEFFKDKEHTNWMGFTEKHGTVIVSILKKETEDSYITIIWTRMRFDRIMVDSTKVKKKKGILDRTIKLNHVLKALKEDCILLDSVSLTRIEDPNFSDSLLKLEQSQIVQNYKFGVLYAKEGQTEEDEMYRNETGSAPFDHFLELLGKKIVLKDWSDYRGGLDIKNNATGTHSIFNKWLDFGIMFHVSTLLPFFPNDPQQVERKRHLGNDIVCIIFVDGEKPFNPSTITSEFIHILIIVQLAKDSNESELVKYRISTASRKEIRPFKPLLSENGIYTHGPELSEFLLYKLVNGERAAYEAPVFASKIKRTRNQLLLNMHKEFIEKK